MPERAQLIAKIPKLEECFVLFSALTKLPYTVENAETADDEIYLFENQTDALVKAKQLTRENDPVTTVKCTRDNLLKFLSTLFTCGINSIVFRTVNDEVSFQLDELIRRNPANNVDEKRRPPENQSLMINMIYYFQEARKPESIRNKQKLLSIEPELLKNVRDADYLMLFQEKEADGKKLRMPVVLKSRQKKTTADNTADNTSDKTTDKITDNTADKTTGGTSENSNAETEDKSSDTQELMWIPLFTDIHELEKFKSQKEMVIMKANLRTLSAVQTNLDLQGYIIDPGSVAMPITLELMKKLMAQQSGAADNTESHDTDGTTDNIIRGAFKIANEAFNNK